MATEQDSAALRTALSCLHSLDEGQTETNELLERIASALEDVAENLDRIATVQEEVHK